MPISNGDAAGSAVERLGGKVEFPDHTKALELLKEYNNRDGLDIKDLLDADKRGALTYNDFLVLPGYIGMHYSGSNLPTISDKELICTPLDRLPCL